MTRRLSVLLLLLGCTSASPPDDAQGRQEPQLQPQPQEVLVYRACEFAEPGELVPLRREIPGNTDAVVGAIGELLRGVTEQERLRGCTSFFSAETDNALQSVIYSQLRDTVAISFRDFSESIPDVPGARSFLPPGVMAELTWTIFGQFDEIHAARFSFEGDEHAFWSWAGGAGTAPQVFTREMWERI